MGNAKAVTSKSDMRERKSGSGGFGNFTKFQPEELQIIEDEESGGKPRNKFLSPTFTSKTKSKTMAFHQKKKSLPITKDKGWHLRKRLYSKH